MVKVILLATMMLFLSPVVSASEAPALSFQAWKERQILDAQNQTLRISARISQLKAAKKGAPVEVASSAPVRNSKLRKAEADPLSSAEKDLRRAFESVQGAGQLTLDDYASVYLPSLQEQPEAVEALVSKLSQEELREILKSLLKTYPSNRSASRNRTVITEALAIRSKASPP